MLRKLLGYGVTAGLAAIVDIGGYIVFMRFGVPSVLAATGSWIVSAAFNYTLTSHYVFGHKISLKHGLRFFLGAAAGLSVNVGITVYANRVWFSEPLYAKITGIGVAFFVNFLINSKIVFKKKL